MQEKTSDVLFRLRMDKGLSQQAIADEVHISRVAYTRYENGTRMPSASIALRLANYFNVRVEDIITGHIVREGTESESRSTNSENSASDSDRSISGEELKLLSMYRSMNEEGREKLMDYADDLVLSGRYIKSGSVGMGKAEA